YLGAPNPRYATTGWEINGRELFTLVPLAVIVAFLGIYPKAILSLQSPRLVEIADQVKAAAPAARGASRQRAMGAVGSLRAFVPGLVLIGALLAVIAIGLARGREAGEWPGTVAFIAAVFALAATLRLPGVLGARGLLAGVPQSWLFGRMLVLDAFSVFFKLLLGLSLLAAVWMSLRSPEVRGRPNEG